MKHGWQSGLRWLVVGGLKIHYHKMQVFESLPPCTWSYDVMVSISDFESDYLGSNPSKTLITLFASVAQ